MRNKPDDTYKIKLNITDQRAKRLEHRFREEDPSEALVKGLLFILGGLALGKMLEDDDKKKRRK